MVYAIEMRRKGNEKSRWYTFSNVAYYTEAAAKAGIVTFVKRQKEFNNLGANNGVEEMEFRIAEAEPQTCSICGGSFVGFGNNAAPVNEGRCCDHCNAHEVIPNRCGIFVGEIS